MAGYIGSRTNNALVSLSGASGTISNDVVFPAGHVIQYKCKEDSSSGDFNLTGTGSDTIQPVGLSESIACSVGSKLIISVEVLVIMNDPQYEAMYSIYKDNGSGTYVKVSSYSGSDWYFYRASDSTQTYLKVFFNVIDNNPSTSSTTYKLYARVVNTSNYFRTHQSTIYPAYMTLMEIAQ